MYALVRHTILSCIFILLIMTGSAQQSLVDTVYARVIAAKTDSDRLDKRITYAMALSKIDLSKGLHEIQEVKKEAIEKKFHDLHVSAVLNLGNIYYDHADYINCIITYEEAQKLYATITNPKLR